MSQVFVSSSATRHRSVLAQAFRAKKKEKRFGFLALARDALVS